MCKCGILPCYWILATLFFSIIYLKFVTDLNTQVSSRKTKGSSSWASKEQTPPMNERFLLLTNKLISLRFPQVIFAAEYQNVVPIERIVS